VITGSERAIRYSELGRVLQEYQPEILLLPANWEFNFPLVENIIETAENKIRSLNVILFSCTNTVAIVMNRKEIKKIKRFGWADAEIR
jgi:hypothetical protein